MQRKIYNVTLKDNANVYKDTSYYLTKHVDDKKVLLVGAFINDESTTEDYLEQIMFDMGVDIVLSWYLLNYGIQQISFKRYKDNTSVYINLIKE